MKPLDRPESILKKFYENFFATNFHKNEDAMLLH